MGLQDELLTAAAGEWDGTFWLWFEPGDPAAESTSRATITTELGGRTALLRYTWRFDEDDHEGLALLGRDDSGTWRMAWTETFGYAGNIMDCSSGDEQPSLLGHYEAEGQRWGWRTTFELPSRDEMVITAHNITPDGDEQLATRAEYRRLPG